MSFRKHVVGLLPIVAGVLLGLMILAPIASAAKVSDEAKRCGAEGNSVEAQVDLAAARDVWKIVPALGISPELEVDGRPALLIVFKGEYNPSAVQFAGEVPARMSGVICVVQEDGTVNLYMDVSRDGSAFTQ